MARASRAPASARRRPGPGWASALPVLALADPEDAEAVAEREHLQIGVGEDRIVLARQPADDRGDGREHQPGTADLRGVAAQRFELEYPLQDVSELSHLVPPLPR